MMKMSTVTSLPLLRAPLHCFIVEASTVGMGVVNVPMPLPLFGFGAVMYLLVIEPPAPDVPLVPVLVVPLAPPELSIGLMVFPGEEAALHAATMANAEATQTKR